MLPEVYDEVRKLASARLARERQPHQTLQPTALLFRGGRPAAHVGLPRPFLAAAALAMRRILVERAVTTTASSTAPVEIAWRSTTRGLAPIPI